MKDALKDFSAIRARLARGCILMLDFDGTLSPIVADYRRARISPKAKRALRLLAARVPVVIVSGRALADVRQRVRMRGLSYVGSHGLELSMRGRLRRAPLSAAQTRAFAAARRALREVARRFGKLPLEDKRMSFAVHYRALSSAPRRAFRSEARRALVPYVRKGNIRIIDHKRTFDIMPDVGATKGSATHALLRILARGRRGAAAVYIGDGTTDEDAFRALSDGITIRVGRSSASAARYFFRTRKDVDTFLARIAQAMLS